MLPETATLVVYSQEYMDNRGGMAVDTGVLLRTRFFLTFCVWDALLMWQNICVYSWETICYHGCGGLKVRSMVTEQTQTYWAWEMQNLLGQTILIRSFWHSEADHLWSWKNVLQQAKAGDVLS